MEPRPHARGGRPQSTERRRYIPINSEIYHVEQNRSQGRCCGRTVRRRHIYARAFRLRSRGAGLASARPGDLRDPSAGERKRATAAGCRLSLDQTLARAELTGQREVGRGRTDLQRHTRLRNSVLPILREPRIGNRRREFYEREASRAICRRLGCRPISVQRNRGRLRGVRLGNRGRDFGATRCLRRRPDEPGPFRVGRRRRHVRIGFRCGVPRTRA